MLQSMGSQSRTRLSDWTEPSPDIAGPLAISTIVILMVSCAHHHFTVFISLPFLHECL